MRRESLIDVLTRLQRVLVYLLVILLGVLVGIGLAWLLYHAPLTWGGS